MSEANYNEGQTQKTNVALFLVLGGCGCLVAIFVIIGILVALLLPAIQAARGVARDSTRRMHCTNNMKQIGLALHNYHDAYKSLPPAYTTDEDGNPLHSWRVLILPYIEQEHLYNMIRLDEPWDSEYNSQFHSQMSSIYCCPASGYEPQDGLTSYMWVVGPDTISDGTSVTTFSDVTAGMSNVIWLVEVNPATCWMAPVDIPQSDLSPGLTFSRDHGIGSKHTGGITVGCMDASVHFLSDSEAGRLVDEVKIKR